MSNIFFSRVPELFKIPFGPLRSFLVLFGPFWSFQIFSVPLLSFQSFLSFFGPVKSSLAFFSPFWPSMVIFRLFGTFRQLIVSFLRDLPLITKHVCSCSCNCIGEHVYFVLLFDSFCFLLHPDYLLRGLGMYSCSLSERADCRRVIANYKAQGRRDISSKQSAQLYSKVAL